MIELQTSHSARPQCGSHVMKSNGKLVLPSLNMDLSWISSLFLDLISTKFNFLLLLLVIRI